MTNYEKIEDGRLLSNMRDNGMSDQDARVLLEQYQETAYTDSQWEEVQYHADMYAIYLAEKNSWFFDSAGNE